MPVYERKYFLVLVACVFRYRTPMEVRWSHFAGPNSIYLKLGYLDLACAIFMKRS